MKKPLTPDQLAETAKARFLHEKLAAIDITEVPVMSTDRCAARKDQAKLARELFKRLGLHGLGISVTTPSYSMAQAVHVSIPSRKDYEWDDNAPSYPASSGCEARKANADASTRLEAILLAAFPRHDDRSDHASDYFDYCWSIRT